mmetsp:Transcript_1644/g.4569  ORF Transcript_1644/g.4569 Transcript_1644/m.4569 type:complete len:420 (+) Transcript_1644:1690-2949(+)
MLHALARGGGQAEEFGVHMTVVTHDSGALHIVAEPAAVVARLPHVGQGLRGQEERAARAAVPVVHPLVVDETVQALRLVQHRGVVVEQATVAEVVHAEVLVQVDGVDGVFASAPQRLRPRQDHGALRHGQRDVPQLRPEVVGAVLVHRLPEGEEPPRVRGLVGVVGEERRPAAVHDVFAHALQECVQPPLEQGLVPRHPGDVQRQQEGLRCEGRRDGGCLGTRMNPTLDRRHDPDVLLEALVLCDLGARALVTDQGKKSLQVQREVDGPRDHLHTSEEPLVHGRSEAGEVDGERRRGVRLQLVPALPEHVGVVLRRVEAGDGLADPRADHLLEEAGALVQRSVRRPRAQCEGIGSDAPSDQRKVAGMHVGENVRVEAAGLGFRMRKRLPDEVGSIPHAQYGQPACGLGRAALRGLHSPL